MEKLTDLLFSNKKKIPEGLYIELMNTCKIVKDTPVGLYKLDYYIINTMVSNNQNVCIDIQENDTSLKKFTKIIDISTVKEPCLIKKITQEPFNIFYDLGEHSTLFPELLSQTKFLRSSHIIKNEPDDDSSEDDDACDFCDDDIRKIRISSLFTCFKYAVVFNVSKLN